jgi:hypothetical protein
LFDYVYVYVYGYGYVIYYQFIIAAGAIGLLNNLTFVIIMENWSSSKDKYTIYVLIGWASS